jgi:integrase
MIRLATLRLQEWPAGDRALWERACAPSTDPWSEAGRASQLRPHTRRNYERAHATWLAWLRDRGELAEDVAPLARVILDRVIGFVAHMQALERANSTIAQMLMNLHSFVTLVSSEPPPRWLIHPGGRSLSEAFPISRKPEVTVDSRALIARAQALHDEAMQRPCGWSAANALRDAALMAILHAHAPRAGDLAGMRLGEHLLEGRDGGWTVRFPPETTKGKRLLEYPLARACVPLMEDYLRHGRPRFRGAAGTTALWLSSAGAGGPMDVVGVTGLVQRRHRDWLGHAHGPHMARKWLTQTARAHGPEAGFDAAAMLGHAPRVQLRHYASALESHAFRRHGERLAALQARAERRAELDAAPGRDLSSAASRDEGPRQ